MLQKNSFWDLTLKLDNIRYVVTSITRKQSQTLQFLTEEGEWLLSHSQKSETCTQLSVSAQAFSGNAGHSCTKLCVETSSLLFASFPNFPQQKPRQLEQIKGIQTKNVFFLLKDGDTISLRKKKKKGKTLQAEYITLLSTYLRKNN